MFSKEEKVILLEAIRTKIHRASGDLENTTNAEIRAKKEKRIELLLSCRTKLLRSRDNNITNSDIEE